MIFTVTIKLVFGLNAEEKWEVSLEMEESTSLADLHEIIQQAVEFDNDHLYEFYIARTDRSRERLRFDDDSGDLEDKTLSDIFPLPKNRKLFYLFDYGDHWVFQVSLSRVKPHPAVPRKKYPRLISEAGKKPTQYEDW